MDRVVRVESMLFDMRRGETDSKQNMHGLWKGGRIFCGNCHFFRQIASTLSDSGERRMSGQAGRHPRMQHQQVPRVGPMVRLEPMQPDLRWWLQGAHPRVRSPLHQRAGQPMQGSPARASSLQRGSLPRLHPVVGVVRMLQDLWVGDQGPEQEVRGLHTGLVQALLPGNVARIRGEARRCS